MGDKEREKIRKSLDVTILGKVPRAVTIAETKKLLEGTDKRRPFTGCERLFLRSQVLPMHPEFDDWQGYFVRLRFDCVQGEEPLEPKLAPDTIIKEEAGDMDALADGVHNLKVSGLADEDRAARDKVKAGSIIPRMKEAWRSATWKSVTSPSDDRPPVVIEPPKQTTDSGARASTDAGPAPSESGPAQTGGAGPTSESGPAQTGGAPWRRKPAFSGTPDEQQKKFRQAVAHAWTIMMALRKGNFHIRVRCMSFERVLRRLQVDYPGENRAQLRKRLASDAKSFAAAFLSAAMDLTDNQQQQIKAAFERFEAAHASKARGPDFMARLSASVFAPDHLCQFIDEINKNMLEHFICRDPGCAHFMPSDMWITNGSQYRCPMCFQKYQPWVSKSGKFQRPWIMAQKIMAIRRPTDSTASAAMDTSTAVQVTVGGKQGVATDFDFYLTTWPDTVTANLQNELKMIYCGLAPRMARMTAEETFAEVADVALRCRNQTYFRSEYVPPDVMSDLKWANEGLTKKHWSVQHLPTVEGRPYVHCARYTYEEGKTHILNNEDLVAMWAHVKWAMAVSTTVKL